MTLDEELADLDEVLALIAANRPWFNQWVDEVCRNAQPQVAENGGSGSVVSVDVKPPTGPRDGP